MDTKLKKSHKITTLIIALCVMIPALLLVSLYPTMEKAMLEKRTEYETERTENEEDVGPTAEFCVEYDFINYAMEASYYIYGQLLNETQTESANFEVLQQYGWVVDYHEVYDNTKFQASYLPGDAEKPYEMKNAEELNELTGRMKLNFDAYGNLTEIETEGLHVWYDGAYDSPYAVAMQSEVQYQNNVKQYNKEQNAAVSYEQLRPKNFTIEFAVDESSSFVHESYYDYGYEYYADSESLYYNIGAYWLVFALAIIVAILALILPFIRPLHTGREKIFSMPFEVMCIVGCGAVSLTIGMALLMSHTTMWELTSAFENGLPQFLGYKISIEMLYKLLLGLSFIAWTVSFFLIYMVFANLRQIFSNTKYYLKNQVLCIRILRWLKRKCRSLYDYVTAIDINEKLNMSIIKIVVANFVILTLLCCMWFFGVAALIVYSIALYVILRKQGEKIQKQYHSILHATEQMADGDLKISLEEDLGVFTPIGESLEKVQQGFEKAVVEEAKSQNMKTELITNVSHDLKTPLTAIITYVDLLKKEDITEEERKSYIATLDQKSQRLKVLIEDLFEVSKAHSGNVKMNFMDVDVVSLLKQVRSEMDEQIENSNLQFRWNLPEEKVILALDGQRTYRVFENLLNNILKYAMPHSRVYVDVNPTDSQVQIQFRNVSAMELDFDVDRLTERFVRGDSSRNTEGSGLGLAIAKSFVELQKGTFEIDVDGDLFKVRITFDRA